MFINGSTRDGVGPPLVGYRVGQGFHFQLVSETVRGGAIGHSTPISPT